MYTETELREALQHSATRADLLLAAKPEPNAPSPAVELRVPVRSQRRSWLPGVAAAGLAAAGVLAVAGGSFLLVAKPAHRSATPPPITVPMTTAPLATAPSRTAVAITNLITLPGAATYLLDAGRETLLAPTGIQLMALPAGRFDPAKQLTDPHPVTVAGSHGYAGKALIDLINPSDSQQADKAGAPINTVAWQTGNHSWLVVQRSSADGADLSVPTLVRDAGQLGVQARPAPLRSAYRAGWLPSGLTLTGAAVNLGKPEGALTLTAGAKSIILELTTESLNATSLVGDSIATKPFGSYTMTVFGTGYDQATVQRVLDNLDFSRLNSSPSTWWTFDQAVNH